MSSYSANVRFGSKADISALVSNVRFTPRSGHGRWAKPLNLLTLSYVAVLELATPICYRLIISGPVYLAVGHDRVRDLSSVLIISSSRYTSEESVLDRLIYLSVDLRR